MQLDPGIEIDVFEGVYPPSEDSFLLLKSIDIKPGENVLEIGTGSGIIAIYCARAGARVAATDISGMALDCAAHNAQKCGVELALYRADLFDGVEGQFDVIVFNAPYLPSERGTAQGVARQTESGTSGIDVTLRFLEECGWLLKRDGKVYFTASSNADLDTLLRHSQQWLDLKRIASERHFFEEILVYMGKAFRYPNKI